jgi:hypothetical protein
LVPGRKRAGTALMAEQYRAAVRQDKALTLKEAETCPCCTPIGEDGMESQSILSPWEKSSQSSRTEDKLVDDPVGDDIEHGLDCTIRLKPDATGSGKKEREEGCTNSRGDGRTGGSLFSTRIPADCLLRISPSIAAYRIEEASGVTCLLGGTGKGTIAADEEEATSEGSSDNRL